MPLFEFECQGCGKVFEVRVPRATAPGVTCPGCGSTTVERLWSPFASPAPGGSAGCATSGSGFG